MEGHASISTDILASYAADAARDVTGVTGLVEGRLPPHRGVRISREDGTVGVELHVGLRWGVSIPGVGAELQERVRDYLSRMAGLEPATVDVVVEEIGGSD